MNLILKLPDYEPKRTTLLYHLKDYGYTWHSGKDLTTYKPEYFDVEDNALVVETVSKTVAIAPFFNTFHKGRFKNDIIIEVL